MTLCEEWFMNAVRWRTPYGVLHETQCGNCIPNTPPGYTANKPAGSPNFAYMSPGGSITWSLDDAWGEYCSFTDTKQCIPPNVYVNGSCQPKPPPPPPPTDGGGLPSITCPKGLKYDKPWFGFGSCDPGYVTSPGAFIQSAGSECICATSQDPIGFGSSGGFPPKDPWGVVSKIVENAPLLILGAVGLKIIGLFEHK